MRTSRLAAVVFLAASPASALTGNELYQNCTDGTLEGKLACAAYIKGVSDGLHMGATMSKAGMTFCWPADGLEPTQARLVVERFLRDRPQHLHELAGILTATALHEAFKCKISN